MGVFGDKLRAVANRMGVDVYAFPRPSDPHHVRRLVLNYLSIDVVLDVGGHVGGYVDTLRRWGYGGKVVSFEPVFSHYVRLARRAELDPRWEARRLALGDTDGTAEIHLANTMSSILPSAHVGNTGTEPVPIARLDTIRRELYTPSQIVWLKIDVQGFEGPVLRGADEALREVAAVEVELGVHPQYTGQLEYRRVIDDMIERGFDLWSVDPHARHQVTGRQIEMDVIFVKRALANDPERMA